MVIVMIVILMTVTLVYRFFISHDDSGPLMSKERNRYVALEFIPKYKTDECSVHFNLYLKKAAGDFERALYNSFQRYLSKHEPKIGYLQSIQVTILNSTINQRGQSSLPYLLLFADQCERRFELFQAMADYTEERHGDQFSFEHVEREGTVAPGEKFWIDSPDFNPDYWPTFHRGMRGDGEAFLALVNFLKPYEQDDKHLYLALAEFYLPSGPLKDQACEQRDIAWKALKPEFQSRQKLVIDEWIQKIRDYSVQ